MTELLANVFGVYMICAGLGLLLRPQWAQDIMTSFEDNAALTYLTGAIVTMAGTALVLTHNIWEGWPEIMVTLFAWGAAIEGAILLIFPSALFALGKKMMPKGPWVMIWGIAIIGLGLALIFI